jgi:hypothetical protein
MDAEDNRSANKQPTASVRGVSYPFIDLQEAVARAQKFYDIERKNAAPIATAVKHWGYSDKSSGGKQTIAALSYYGLLQDLGSGEHRQVKLTDRALDIIHSPLDSKERKQALQDAAAAPKLYGELLSKYTAHELPSDDTLRFFLLRTKDVNQNSVDALIRNFRATLSFSGLDSPTANQWSANTQSHSSGVTNLTEGPDSVAGQGTRGNTVITPGAGTLSMQGGASAISTQGSGAMREEVCSLNEGMVVLRWPSNISKSSVLDLGEWLDLVKRKIERAASAIDQTNT